MIILNIIYYKCSIYGKKVNWKYVDSFLMLQDSSVTWLKQNLISNKKEYREKAPKNSSASAIWLAAENIQNIHLFLLSKLAKVWLKNGQEMEDQEERMKNNKYRSLKMIPSDIILKFKNM